jgi:regulator of protease activity HflC (stomatin/prohibitin superfamily)
MPEPTSNPNQTDPQPLPQTIVPAPVPSAEATSAAEENDQLDAANESLAGALSVSFSVLRIVMILLIAVFLLSGFFTVAPDEVAVRTRFGRIIPGPDGEVLHPEGGPYFRWPAPVGQVYRIPTIPRKLNIDESFVFRAAVHEKQRPLSELNQGPRLDPQFDGALLTADQSIVHARYEVTYQVLPDNAARFARNVASVSGLDTAVGDRFAIFEGADDLVRNAVEQAIVEDVAGTPLDRFLQGGRSQAPAATATPPGAETPTEPAEPSGSDAAADDAQADQTQPPPDQPGQDAAEQPAGEAQEPSADVPSSLVTGGGQEDRVRAEAQRVLDELQSGITIVTVTRTEQMVASNVVQLNNAVAVELGQARTKRNQAENYRNTQLISAAGASWPGVLAVIDAYEEAYRLRDTEPDRFTRAEQAVEATFNGQPLGPVLEQLAADLPEDNPLRRRLEVEGRRHASAKLGGQAGARVSTASSEASAYIAALEAEAVRFERRLATYRQRPDLVRRSMLSETLSAIFSNPDAETSFLAPGTELRLLISRDRQTQLEEESRARAQRDTAARTPLPTIGPSSGEAAPPQAPPPRPADDGHDH